MLDQLLAILILLIVNIPKQIPEVQCKVHYLLLFRHCMVKQLTILMYYPIYTTFC